jgi:hypothetical protein
MSCHRAGHSRSGRLVQDRLHLGACEGPHCLCADVAQHVRSQQHTRRRFVVRRFEDAHLVIMTKRPIHVFDAHSHRLHLGGPVGHPLRRLLSGLDAFIGELH